MNVKKEVAALERLTVNDLRERYAEVYGESTNGRHKQWLVRRIVWRMQALEEGDLSERARRRAREIANDADVRVIAPKAKAEPAFAVPKSASRLSARQTRLSKLTIRSVEPSTPEEIGLPSNRSVPVRLPKRFPRKTPIRQVERGPAPTESAGQCMKRMGTGAGPPFYRYIQEQCSA